MQYFRYYKLNGQTPVPVTEMIQAEVGTRVDLTESPKVRVSTVFLGINHNWSKDGAPLIFETMIFGGPYHEEQRRYSTWEEAKAGHAEMARKAFGWRAKFWHVVSTVLRLFHLEK